MIHFYPGYRLEHFYTLSYWEGGLTYVQVGSLYEQMLKMKNEEIEFKNHEYEFQAAIHGAKLKNKPTGKAEQPRNQDLPIFQSPETYEKMSQEEKDRLTKEMMQKHKVWSRQNKMIG